MNLFTASQRFVLDEAAKPTLRIKEIAHNLHLSVRTVKFHLSSIYKILQVSSLEGLRERCGENDVSSASVNLATLRLFYTTSKRLQTLGVGFEEQLNKLAIAHGLPVSKVKQHLTSLGLSEFKRNKEEVDSLMSFFHQQYLHIPAKRGGVGDS